MRYRTLFLVALFAILAGLAARAQPPAGDAARGKKIFVDSGKDLEYPSCAHCHATVPAAGELRRTGHVRPGHTMWNVTRRGRWKNKPPGKLARAADAGNLCVVAFQKRAKLGESALADLEAYLATLADTGTQAAPLKIGYKPALPASLEGGDRERGRKKMQMYCGGCHGASDAHIAFEFRPNRIKREKVARKVRGYVRDRKQASGMRFKPDAGMMSFWAKDRLPDADLLDILAYVGK